MIRCQWAVKYPELIPYHDEAWGQPTHDDQVIFAALGQCILHAGLLWTALLKKREQFASAFDGWNIDVIARYGDSDMARLLEDSRVIRNVQKLSSVIHDARKIREVQQEFGSFAPYIWRYVDEPLQPDDARMQRVAEKMSKDLKARGFKFTGPATCYGLMEDIGMIAIHDPACDVGKEVQASL